MPHHHSSRLDWTNLVDYPGLATAGSSPLRFVFDLQSREITAVPSQHRWRARYRAQVMAVCRP
jgi:hypothetical protein